uniref:Uncharacterized protein n=1 Tax=Rhizophora mucronata TaxID=61149 RepID=A0A2P2PM37_RHIMU
MPAMQFCYIMHNASLIRQLNRIANQFVSYTHCQASSFMIKSKPGIYGKMG